MVPKNDHFNYEEITPADKRNISIIGRQDNGRSVSPLEYVGDLSIKVFDESINEQLEMIKPKKISDEGFIKLSQLVWRK